jgi:hypothetical protein
MYECDNCGCRYPATNKLKHVFPDIPDLLQRLDPGGTVPAGECPACGALVYAVKPAASVTIVVIALGAWGKADTYEAALAKCVEVGGRQNASNMHVVYACTDPDCVVNGMGEIEYRAGATLKKVVALRFGRVMQPKKAAR